jgi:hypothetical protein
MDLAFKADFVKIAKILSSPLRRVPVRVEGLWDEVESKSRLTADTISSPWTLFHRRASVVFTEYQRPRREAGSSIYPAGT